MIWWGLCGRKLQLRRIGRGLDVKDSNVLHVLRPSLFNRETTLISASDSGRALDAEDINVWKYLAQCLSIEGQKSLLGQSPPVLVRHLHCSSMHSDTAVNVFNYCFMVVV